MKKAVKKTSKKIQKKSAKKTPARRKSVKAGGKATSNRTKKITRKSAGDGKKAQKKETAVTLKESAKEKALRENLLRHRNRVLQEAKTEIAKFIKGESRQIVDTSLDDAGLSQIDISEDLNLRKLSAHKETLEKIDEALRKVTDGTYGICEDCGSEISEERLRVIPFAIYCIDCKEKRERMEEFEKEG